VERARCGRLNALAAFAFWAASTRLPGHWWVDVAPVNTAATTRPFRSTTAAHMGQFRQSRPSSIARNGPRIARTDPRNGESERADTRKGARLPAGARGPGGGGSGAAGDPLGA